MNGPFFHFETVEAPTRCVKIRFEKTFAASGGAGTQGDPLQVFEEFFNKNLAKGYVHFHLDLGHVPFPSMRFIALLIALTVRVRRRQGEIQLLNVTDTARTNFATFSALNYLSIKPITTQATDPQTVIPAPAPREEPPAISHIATAKEKPSIIKSAAAPKNVPPKRNSPLGMVVLEEEPAGLTDIVEPPLVHEMAKKIEEAPAAEKKFQLRVESRPSNLYQLCDFVTAHALTAGIGEKEIGKIKIAVYEACLNVIEHAYHSRPDEWIDLKVLYTPEEFTIVIEDHGLSFEMKPPTAYDVQEVMDKRRGGGFGLHIIRRSMDSVEYHPDVIEGNRLIMIKKLR